MPIPPYEQVSINGTDIALWDIGSGDPVMFIHGGTGDECLAVIQQPALTEHFRVILYQRPGYALSGEITEPVTMASVVAQIRAVMRHLEIDRAHFQGLSLGGSIALQFAHDHPDTVQSLAVMEPGILQVFGNYPDVMEIMGNVGELYMSGDRDAALKVFLEELIGPNYDEELSRHLPEGWYTRTRRELDVLMQHENPMLEHWEFNEEHAKQITCPVLNVTGELSRPYFKDVHELMKKWFPQSENAVVPDTGHFMLETNPRACADILSTFFRKYPILK